MRFYSILRYKVELWGKICNGFPSFFINFAPTIKE